MTVATTSAVPARTVLRALHRARRASSAAKPLSEVLQDLYVVVFGAVVVAAISAPLAKNAVHDVVVRGQAGRAPHDLVPALGVALALAAVGAGARALTLVGPVVCDPARATWLLASPVSRAGLLGGAAALAVTSAAAAGAVVGLACGALLSWPLPASAVTGGLVAALLGLVAVLAQPDRTAGRRLRRTGDALALLAVPVLVAGLVGAPVRPAAHGSAVWMAPVVVALVAVAAAGRAPRALRRTRRSDLVAGTGVATGLRATVTALDGSFVAETLRLRRLLERGVVGSKPLRGSGFQALVVADLRRVRRAPRGVLAAVGASPLVWAADDLYGRFAAAVALVVVAWAGAGAAAGGLRTVSRTPSLARALPLPDVDLRLAHLAVPAAVAAVVSEVACLLAGQPSWWTAVVTVVAACGVLRTAGGRPDVRWELQATSPLGAMPVGAVTAFLVGPDVVVLASLPWVLGASPAVSEILPFLAAAVLLRRRARRA